MSETTRVSVNTARGRHIPLRDKAAFNSTERKRFGLFSPLEVEHAKAWLNSSGLDTGTMYEKFAASV